MEGMEDGGMLYAVLFSHIIKVPFPNSFVLLLDLNSTPGGNTLSAAEHTCALISSMAR